MRGTQASSARIGPSDLAKSMGVDRATPVELAVRDTDGRLARHRIDMAEQHDLRPRANFADRIAGGGQRLVADPSHMHVHWDVRHPQSEPTAGVGHDGAPGRDDPHLNQRNRPPCFGIDHHTRELTMRDRRARNRALRPRHCSSLRDP